MTSIILLAAAGGLWWLGSDFIQRSEPFLGLICVVFGIAVFWWSVEDLGTVLMASARAIKDKVQR